MYNIYYTYYFEFTKKHGATIAIIAVDRTIRAASYK